MSAHWGEADANGAMRVISGFGTSRHLAALQNLVAIGSEQTSIKLHRSSSIHEYAP
jgi:hypothetical protein